MPEKLKITDPISALKDVLMDRHRILESEYLTIRSMHESSTALKEILKKQMQISTTLLVICQSLEP